VQFIPYSCQNITDEDVEAVVRVLRSEYLTQGPTITEFETEFAQRHNVKHAIAVSNATAGLHIACLALDVNEASLVWTSPNSFLASANCARYCGASVDFVDINAATRNMSVDALEEKLRAARKSGDRLPNVVIPVHFAGLPCDLREIRALADEFGFKVLEDASHATGASYEGQSIGSRFADASVFSFHAVKIVTTAEGGLVATQDAEIARRLKLLRSHGMTRSINEMERQSEGGWYYEQQALGYNYRMTDVQAALGISQMRRLDAMHARREALANRYDELLTKLPLILPARIAGRQSAWHLYAVEIDDSRTAKRREGVFRELRAASIGVNVHYIPIHTQPYYARLGFKRGAFPNSERYYSRALSLPLFPALTEQQQQYVADTLSQVLA
jgi:UDP-4-amino-4,6-dideoxy-N-acetyl-beta-L-altrosamine transaminase